MKIRKRGRRKSRRVKSVRRKSRPVSRMYIKPAKRRRVKRSGRISGSKIQNILMRGAIATAGAGLAVFATNGLLKMLGAKIDAGNKKWVFIGTALGLGMLLPKLQFTRKYATELTTGAVVISLMQLAASNASLKQFFSLAGSESDELDQIISNLNVQGALDLGARETGLLGAREMSGSLELEGVLEQLEGLDQDAQEEYE